MTSVRLRKPILTKQTSFPTYIYICHLGENTLNISQIWAITTPGNQFSSPNWVATDLPQGGLNSFQHSAGASSWSCVFFSVSWHVSFFMHCESQLYHSGVPILHDMTGATLLYFSCFRLPRVQLRTRELQCHVAHFSTIRTVSEQSPIESAVRSLNG